MQHSQEDWLKTRDAMVSQVRALIDPIYQEILKDRIGEERTGVIRNWFKSYTQITVLSLASADSAFDARHRLRTRRLGIAELTLLSTEGFEAWVQFLQETLVIFENLGIAER